MFGYLVRRVLWAIPTLWGAVTLVFLVMNILPGDVAMVILGRSEGAMINPDQYAALREQLGLNRSLWEQYGTWILGLVRFDLGVSPITGRPVIASIDAALPYTMSIVVLSLILTVITSIPAGVISALHQDHWPDYLLRIAVVGGISIPNFFLGVIILLVAINYFRWSPPLEYATVWENPLVAFQQLALPSLVLGFRGATSCARMARSTMLEVMHEDYVRTARAQGVPEREVVYVHALRNAILPVVTMFGMEVIFLFGGTVVIETIFRVPGIGQLLMASIQLRDIVMVEGVVVMIVFLVLAVNLAVDVLYGYFDPRVRFGAAGR